MIKRHKKSATKLMRRACRVYLNDVNAGKCATLRTFLHLCHDATQYAIDLFWQRQDFSATLADLATAHRIRDRFKITTRLAQALAKQAKECIRSARTHGFKRKPRLRKHTVTLYSHFMSLAPFQGAAFDYALTLIGSGAPKDLVVPFRSTRVINRRLQDGWTIDHTVRMGRAGTRLWVEVMMVKERPALQTSGVTLGMDSNYKNGLVLSNGQSIGQGLYALIQTFGERRKHTHRYIGDEMARRIKAIPFSHINTLAVEDLKLVKSGTRGTFSRRFNRRLSHWLYASAMDLISRHCEAHGVRLVKKNPWKTSQFCRACGNWDRRNRRGDRFTCVHCGFSSPADYNAAKNLELLGLAGVYGLRSLPTSAVEHSLLLF